MASASTVDFPHPAAAVMVTSRAGVSSSRSAAAVGQTTAGAGGGRILTVWLVMRRSEVETARSVVADTLGQAATGGGDPRSTAGP